MNKPDPILDEINNAEPRGLPIDAHIVWFVIGVAFGMLVKAWI